MRLGYYFKFPDGCTDATDFAHCRGTCPLLDYRLDELADWQVYKVLDTGDILSALADFMLGTDPFTGESSAAASRFVFVQLFDAPAQWMWRRVHNISNDK